MNQLNDNLFIEEVKSEVESLTVMLNLLLDTEFTIRVVPKVWKHCSYEYKIDVFEKNNLSNSVIDIYVNKGEDLEVYLDRYKFQKNLATHYYLKGMSVKQVHKWKDYGMGEWEITCNGIEDLRKIIKLVNKSMIKGK